MWSQGVAGAAFERPQRGLQNGYETPVDYTLSPPVIRVKIQKAFGTYTLPRVGAGTKIKTLHAILHHKSRRHKEKWERV